MGSPPPTLTQDQDRFKTITDLIEWAEDYRPGKYHPVHFGDLIKDSRYKIIRKLGYGSFSTVWLARDQHASLANRYVALKIVAADTSSSLTELDILDRLSSSDTHHDGQKHVMTLMDTFMQEGPNGKHLCLVFEAIGPSAFDLIENHPSKFGGSGPDMYDIFYGEAEDHEAVGGSNPDESIGGNFSSKEKPAVLDSKNQVEDDAECYKPVSYRTRLPLQMTRSIVHYMLLAVEFLYRNDITHSDLQPGNILFHVTNLSSVLEEDFSKEDKSRCTIPVGRRDGKPDPWAPKYLALNRSLADYIELDREFQIKISNLGSAFFSEKPPSKPVISTGHRSPELLCNGEIGPSQDIWSR